MRILSLVLALIAVAAAGYAAYCGQARVERIDKLERSAETLEASIAGLWDQLKARPETHAGPAEEEASRKLQDRVAKLEGKLASLETAPQTGRSSKEILSDGAREFIRRIVQEEQAALVDEQKQERVARREKMQDKFKEMAEKHEEKQRKRLEEWVKKFSEKSGLTIAQEEGILDAYRWASEERNRILSEKRKEGGPVLFGPEDFAKIGSKRDGKIKEMLSEAQFGELEKYRSENPLPEMGFFAGIGDDGEMGADAIIMEVAQPSEKKKEQSERENEGK